MKFLLINFSPRPDGCTARALKECEHEIRRHGHRFDIINVDFSVDCNNCRLCKEKKECIDRVTNDFGQTMHKYDGFIFGSPVYYGGINATAKAFLTKLFYAYPKCMEFKPVCCVVSSRRAGSLAALQEFYAPFLMHSCYIVGSQYWCEVHGDTPDEVVLDYEGLQCLRTMTQNLIYAADSLSKNKEHIPVHEPKKHLNFISREYKDLKCRYDKETFK